MAVARITRSDTTSTPQGPQGSLLDELNPVFPTGSRFPGAGPGPGPNSAQVQGFLDGLHGYLEQMIKLDLAPEHLISIEKVLAGQVSQVLGEQVPPGKWGTNEDVASSETIPDVAPTETIQDVTSTGQVPGSGKTPAGMPEDMWALCVTAGKKTCVDPYILAAQMERESRFGAALGGSPSGGDGLMQVEPSTRADYASRFQEKIGHAYDHGSKQDQVDMAAVILADKGGGDANMLQKYNGGDGWKPGVTDSYGREIKAGEYAESVLARAEAMKGSAA